MQPGYNHSFIINCGPIDLGCAAHFFIKQGMQQLHARCFLSDGVESRTHQSTLGPPQEALRVGGGGGGVSQAPTQRTTNAPLPPLHNHGQSARPTGSPWLNKPISTREHGQHSAAKKPPNTLRCNMKAPLSAGGVCFIQKKNRNNDSRSRSSGCPYFIQNSNKARIESP